MPWAHGSRSKRLDALPSKIIYVRDKPGLLLRAKSIVTYLCTEAANNGRHISFPMEEHPPRAQMKKRR
eukprot:scaffold1368_cov333-Pavlova_lutheri.AAC.36